VEEDAGEDVLRGVVGDGLVEILGVGGWEGVEGDVLEAEVEDGRVEEDEGHVAGRFGGHWAHRVLDGMEVEAALFELEEVGGRFDIGEAKAYECVTGEFGAELGEVEGTENWRFRFFCTGR